MFHTECIATNANISDNKCPNCRQPIPSFRNIFTGYQNSKKDKSTDKIISNEVCLIILLNISSCSIHFFNDIG